MSNKNYSLDITWSTIFRIAVAAVILYFLFLIKDLLIWFLFAVIISVLFEPAIKYLTNKKVPRTIAVLGIYLGTFGALSLVIYFTVPLFLSEIQNFSQFFSHYFERISGPLTGLGFEAFQNFESFFEITQTTLRQSASTVFSGLIAIFGGLSSTAFTLSLALFLSLEENAVENTLRVVFPKEYEDFITRLWARCRKRVTDWFGVRVLASLFVGIITYGVLLLFNVKYPFSLALLAGVLEFIPVLGPLVTGGLAFMMIALDSMVKALFVLAFFGLIQQIEAHVLTPLLSKRMIGLPPVLILMALAIGGTLWGLLGAILAIPLLGILFEFVRDLLKKRKKMGSG